jgi:alkaline phosphatase D
MRLTPCLALLLVLTGCVPICRYDPDRHAIQPAAHAAEAPANPPLQRIAFGSCARQDRPQPIWDTIAGVEPDVFIYLGDTVYPPGPGPHTADQLQQAFDTLDDVETFARFREAVPVVAVWDDHDYGLNDGGADHPHRDAAQDVFLRFFDEPADSPRWAREGLYHSTISGPPGRRTQIILLDTRYHRSPLRSVRVLDENLYLPSDDRDATVLGEQQWQWLEAQLRQPAELRLLVTSIQLLPNAHPFERWGALPFERQRMLDLLDQPHVNGLLILSGDQHLGELSRLNRPANYPLLELTSSGLTHTRGPIPAPNPLRVGDMTLDLHFGLITIDWSTPDPTLTLAILGINGHPRITHRVQLVSR